MPCEMSRFSSFVPCSEKIHTAVTEMASLFPKVSFPFPDFSFCPADTPPPCCPFHLFRLFFRSGLHWMRSTAPSACWPPAPPGCRWSVARPPRLSPGPLRWTTSSSLSRSYSAPTISPRLPSSWSPLPLVKKNSDGQEERGDIEDRGRKDR